jgi:hypothetical protein
MGDEPESVVDVLYREICMHVLFMLSTLRVCILIRVCILTFQNALIMYVCMYVYECHPERHTSLITPQIVFMQVHTIRTYIHV